MNHPTEIKKEIKKHQLDMQNWGAYVYQSLSMYFDHKILETEEVKGTGTWRRDYKKALLYVFRIHGKAFRAYLIYMISNYYQVKKSAILDTSMAIELVHNYSLCQDDLPSMDNSPIRRNYPSLFAAFNEASALLVSDALLTEAFSILSVSPFIVPKLALKMIHLLTQASGMNSLLRGQFQDLFDDSLNWESLEELYIQKTGKIFGVSMALGATLGEQPIEIVHKWQKFGEALGVLFQIKDDLLSYQNQPHIIGKPSLLKPIHHFYSKDFFEQKLLQHMDLCIQMCRDHFYNDRILRHHTYDLEALVYLIAERRF